MEGFNTEPHRFNQGIVDGRPEGAQPPRAEVVSDTVTDTDASMSPSKGSNAAHPGPDSSATSQTVHQGLGHPGSGMSSKEERHDGKHQSRKREGQGVSQWGPPKVKDTELDRATRSTGSDVGPTSPV